VGAKGVQQALAQGQGSEAMKNMSDWSLFKFVNGKLVVTGDKGMTQEEARMFAKAFVAEVHRSTLIKEGVVSP